MCRSPLAICAVMLLAAPLAAQPQPTSFLLAPEYPQRPANPKGEIFFTTSVQVDAPATWASVVISGSPNGTAPAAVDDELFLDITPPSPYPSQFTHDFSHGCFCFGPCPDVLDVTSYFPKPGRYTIFVRLRDICGTDVSSTHLWLVFLPCPPGGGTVRVEGSVLVRTVNSTRVFVVKGADVAVCQGGQQVACTRTDVNGIYSVALPPGAPPGFYTIKTTVDFGANFCPPIVNYRYWNQAQDPTENPGGDQILLLDGLNDRMTIWIPQPVILVHGILGDPEETWGEAKNLLRLDPAEKWRQERLVHRAYVATSLTYTMGEFHPVPGGPSIPDHVLRGHRSNAAILADAVNFARRVLARHMEPDVPIDVVAHSMGGLVTRAYLHDWGALPGHGQVDRVLMFGTPNAGVAKFRPGIPGFCECLFPLPWTAFEQLSAAYIETVFEQEVFRTQGARFILVGSSQDYDCAEPEGCRPQWGEEDDEWVSRYSAQYLPANVPQEQILLRATTNDRHQGLHTGQTLREALLPYLERTFTRP